MHILDRAMMKLSWCFLEHLFLKIERMIFDIENSSEFLIWSNYSEKYGKIGINAGRGKINAVKKMYLIGEISRKVNLSQKRIREYEKEGLLAPIRDANTNNRYYTDLDIKQIKQINKLIHKHGLTISCLKTLLKSAPCWNIFDCRKTGECEAYKNPHLPCYVTMKNAPDTKCKTCPIYLNRSQKPIKILVQ